MIWKKAYTFCAVLISVLAGPYAYSIQVANPILVLQTGHGGWVDRLAFSNDGNALLSRGNDGSIKIWNPHKLSLVRSFVRSRMATVANFEEPVALSPFGDFLLVGRMDGYVDAISTLSGTISVGFSPAFSGLANSAKSRYEPPITAVGISYNGRWRIASNVDGSVVAFDTTEHSAQVIQQQGSFATDVTFDTRSDHVMVRLADGTVLLRNLGTSEKAQFSASQLSPTASLAFAPGGDVLVADQDGNGIVLFDVSTGSSKHLQCQCLHPLLSADGESLLTLEGDSEAFRKLNIWSTKDLHLLHSGVPPPTAKEVALTNDGTEVAFGGFDGSVSLLSITKPFRIEPLSGRVRSPVSLQWLSDSELAVIDDDGGAQSWSPARGNSRIIFQTGPAARPALSGNGRYVVFKNTRNDILFHDLQTGNTETVKTNIEGTIYSLAINDTGDRVAFSSAVVDPIAVVDRAIHIASAIEAGKQEPSEAGSRNALQLPLFLAKRSDGDWRVDEMCHSKNQVPSAVFGETKFYPINCTSDAVKTTAASAQFGTAMLATDEGLTVIRADRIIDIKTTEPSPISAAISPDGHWGAVSNNVEVEVVDIREARSYAHWRPESAVQIPLLATSRGAPLIAIANDGITYLIEGSGVINFYSLAGTKLGTLLSIDDYLWVVLSPDGRFDTSAIEQVSQTIKWRVQEQDPEVLPLEIFTRDFFTPKLLAELLGQKLTALRSVGSLNRVQPKVELHGSLENRDSGKLTVTIQVSNNRSAVQKDSAGRYLESGLYDVRLFRDGQLVGQWPEPSTDEVEKVGPITTEAELQAWRKAHEVKLDASGKATITFHNIQLPQRAGVEKVQFTAYAFNSDRVKSLTTPPFEYVLPKSGKAIVRRAYLIAMGVNANQSPNLNLELAVSSAERARALLHSKLQGEYREVVEIPLFSDLASDSNQMKVNRAKKADLKTVLDLLAGRAVDPKLREEVDPKHQLQTATPDDAVVVYVASHGYADPQGTFYLMPSDTGANWGVTEDILTHCKTTPDHGLACKQAEDLLGHSVSSSELATWWSGIDGGEMVMILDSCHSGAVPGKEFRPGPLGDPGFGQLSYDKGMQILSATQPAQTEQGEWVTGGEGRTLLVDALETVATQHPEQSLGQWLHGVEEQLPQTAQQLYPGLKEEDVQVPMLLDFANTEQSIAERR